MIFVSLPNEDGDEPVDEAVRVRLPCFGVCEPDMSRSIIFERSKHTQGA